MTTEQLREKLAQTLWYADRREEIPLHVPQLALSMEMNSIYYGQLADQILKTCQEADLAFVGDIAYEIPSRYSREVRVDDAYAQGFKDAQDTLFKAGYRKPRRLS